jgi:hypothetical protein
LLLLLLLFIPLYTLASPMPSPPQHQKPRFIPFGVVYNVPRQDIQTIGLRREEIRYCRRGTRLIFRG